MIGRLDLKDKVSFLLNIYTIILVITVMFLQIFSLEHYFYSVEYSNFYNFYYTFISPLRWALLVFAGVVASFLSRDLISLVFGISSLALYLFFYIDRFSRFLDWAFYPILLFILLSLLSCAYLRVKIKNRKNAELFFRLFVVISVVLKTFELRSGAVLGAIIVLVLFIPTFFFNLHK